MHRIKKYELDALLWLLLNKLDSNDILAGNEFDLNFRSIIKHNPDISENQAHRLISHYRHPEDKPVIKPLLVHRKDESGSLGYVMPKETFYLLTCYLNCLLKGHFIDLSPRTDIINKGILELGKCLLNTKKKQYFTQIPRGKSIQNMLKKPEAIHSQVTEKKGNAYQILNSNEIKEFIGAITLLENSIGE